MTTYYNVRLTLVDRFTGAIEGGVDASQRGVKTLYIGLLSCQEVALTLHLGNLLDNLCCLFLTDLLSSLN